MGDTPPAMNALLHTSAAGLDHLRARMLRLTLRSPALRRVFLDRALRLLVLFALFQGVALVLCTLVPMWQLVLGPLIYGYAHLVSSVRYLHHGVSDNPPSARFSRRWIPLAALVTTYGLYRLLRLDLTGAPASEWADIGLIEGVFVALAAASVAWAARLGRRQLPATAAVVLPLCVLLWTEPRLTIATLAFGHNFVGFLYWMRMARTQREYRVAIACLVLFSLLTVGVASGALLPLRELVGIDLESGAGGVSLIALGRMMTPDGGASPEAIATAFALGQSTHYFVWLKALPDQVHAHPVPTSYRQSVRLLERDFGAALLRWIGVGVLGGLLLWLLLGLEAGRAVYFAVAGFHGLLELAGLGLLRGPSSPSPSAATEA